MSTYQEMCDHFRNPNAEDGMYSYFEPGVPNPAEEVIAAFVAACKSDGVRCIIPRLCETHENNSGVLEAMRHTYALLLHYAHASGVKVAFNLEKIIETTVVRRVEEEGDSLRAQVIDKLEHYCDQLKHLSLSLLNNESTRPLTVAAVNPEREETMDLRTFVTEDGKNLEWDVPYGNWTVEEFYLQDDPRPNVDYLDYEKCRRYLTFAYRLFEDLFNSEDGQALGAIHYADISFHAPNRRNWNASFDRTCAAKYGFDPAPLYPHLFRSISPDTPNAKAILFSVRAEMMQKGICSALADFAKEHNLRLISMLSEPKLSACSFVSGDALLNNAFSPGALLDRSYLYGINSLKIAAAGAYNFGRKTITCELFRDYYQISLPIIYKDAINAMGRGANLLLAHTENFHRVIDSFDDPNHTWKRDFFGFLARCRALLRGGHHVSDIAVLYPIHSLHSNVNFYRDKVNGFEYPHTPFSTDYLTLINSIAFYAGHDITLLHPDTFTERCSIHDGMIHMESDTDKETFPILVLPSAELVKIEVVRQVRRFYENGGHVIATGDLPKHAFEWKPEDPNDEAHTQAKQNQALRDEIRSHICAVFGEEVLDPNYVVNVVERQNEAGGRAIWLYQSQTATDGTMMVDCKLLSKILHSFDIPFDIYLPTMPRFICTGALNNPYPEFKALGLHCAVPGGGMLSHLHMRHKDVDVFYFGNTSDSAFKGKALLRGIYSLVACNPHTGTVTPLNVRYAKTRGAYYTEVELHLSPVEAVILLSNPDDAPDSETINVFNRPTL